VSEIEGRNPKSEPVGLQDARKKPDLSRSSFIQTHWLLGEESTPLNGPPSGFGLRISFGFRASDFGLCHKPVSTQNSEEHSVGAVKMFVIDRTLYLVSFNYKAT
jgi:hypothetical protein